MTLTRCLALALAILPSCGESLASPVARPPDYAPKDQTQCSVVASHTKPLVVEWPSADRGELEAHVRSQGLVVVEYSGCQMRILDRCTSPSKYGYAPITKKVDRLAIHDRDDLYANVPVGAAKLEGKLQKSGQLDVAMTLVGRWECNQPSPRFDQLQGDCAGATHVVSAVSVGAFTFTAGAEAEVGGGVHVLGAGGGVQSTAKRETLSSDGSDEACEKATLNDRAPPDECGALIRLEVMPIEQPASPFAGKWSCTATGTVTAGAQQVSATATAAHTIIDRGDGTIMDAAEAPGGVSCLHTLRVSGGAASLDKPSTCSMGNVVETATSGTLTLRGSSIVMEARGMVTLANKTQAVLTSTGMCTKQ